MKNDYQASEVLSMGAIGDFVLGAKPWSPSDFDVFFGWWRSLWVSPEDLDEDDI